MTSKQLGKLRQWAGEVISTREKTQPSSEFVALEQDMEARKKGLDKMYTASRDYVEYISQKQSSEVVPGDPMMHSEALGVVMIEHGEVLGGSSALGRSMASLGRARCQIATIQNIYAVTIADSFLTYLDRSKAELEEYVAQRKKLESRRLAYDAAIVKAEKTYKKEKDKKEAEEELARARARYKEMAEDVRARMDAIREGEVEYQRELRLLLQSEIKYAEQYLEVLREVEVEWPQPDTYTDLRRPTKCLMIGGSARLGDEKGCSRRTMRFRSGRWTDRRQRSLRIRAIRVSSGSDEVGRCRPRMRRAEGLLLSLPNQSLV